jgi:hypothetical protein
MMPWVVLMVYASAGVARAQTFNDLQILLGAYMLSPDGGEKPVGVWRSTGPVVIGGLTKSTFYFGDACDAFGVSAGGSVNKDATTAWRIDVTPTRVVGDAVTFRLRWVRFAALQQQLDQISSDLGHASDASREDVELTLRPGESWPVDSVRVPSGAKAVDGRRCGNTASIRASVDSYPWEQEERRLLVADLWLVERLANGAEARRSEALSIRGLPNRPFPFYFDSIVDGKTALDISGRLIAHLDSGDLAVSVETRCRWGEAPPSHRVGGPERTVKSEIRVKPGEVVDVRLPPFGNEAGPFATRELSIRIRARQLR